MTIKQQRLKNPQCLSHSCSKMPCKIGYKGGISRDGKKEGFGTNTYMNGNRYVGAWKNDVREGKGTMFHASGDRYEGCLLYTSDAADE